MFAFATSTKTVFLLATAAFLLASRAAGQDKCAGGSGASKTACTTDANCTALSGAGQACDTSATSIFAGQRAYCSTRYLAWMSPDVAWSGSCSRKKVEYCRHAACTTDADCNALSGKGQVCDMTSGGRKALCVTNAERDAAIKAGVVWFGGPGDANDAVPGSKSCSDQGSTNSSCKASACTTAADCTKAGTGCKVLTSYGPKDYHLVACLSGKCSDTSADCNKICAEVYGSAPGEDWECADPLNKPFEHSDFKITKCRNKDTEDIGSEIKIAIIIGIVCFCVGVGAVVYKVVRPGKPAAAVVPAQIPPPAAV